jgi:uncharacterized membrane protein YdjX (TVP38/TMEM64 family)
MIVILFIIILNTELVTLLRQEDMESIKAIFNENLLFTLGITLLSMIIQNTFTLIPSILLITINVTFFGFFYGYLWSWFTSVFGSIIVFLIVRYWFQDLLFSKVNQKMNKRIEENGFVVVFISRIFPFIPTSIVNLAAGVSSIRFKHFILATLLGNMIYMFALSLIPLGLLSLDFEQFIFVIIAIILVVKIFHNNVSKNKNKNLLFNFRSDIKGKANNDD